MSTTEMCQEVEESLSDLLDGTANARLYDHVAECDACRDLKHEAGIVAGRVRDAGAEFHPAEDFVEKLLGRLEAARPATSGPQLSTGSVTRTASGIAGEADGAIVRTGPIEPGGETAATMFDPLAAAKAAEVETRSSVPSSAPAPSGVSATTHHGPITRPEPAAEPVIAAVASAVETKESTPFDAAAPVVPVAPEVAPRRGGACRPPAPVVKLVPPFTRGETPQPPAQPAPARANVVSLREARGLRRPALLAGAIGVIAAAAALGFYLKGTHGSLSITSADGPWSGSVTSVARAAADPAGGLEVCDRSGACSPVASGGAVRAGSTLRTDSRTRVHVTLADGTDLAIDRATEVELSRGKSRAARLAHGMVVADVAHVEGSTARFAFPHGEVEVLGTKLAITAGDERASVEVARGSVRVKNDAGKTVDVRAGEEATLAGNAEPVVSGSTTLADVMEWSDNKPEDVDSPLLRGLGELRARKPGQTKEKDRAVRLSRHGVKVRIVDVVARTEVDETFSNDTDEELEGIFRFPLPPGAQIEKLSLEVDGKMIDGAFVDRDKGAAIWRGVIQHAAPTAPKPKEEIVWVPGPWRDPALLEWQRGGRFELKIFPIPRRGSRRVVLTYTQLVDQSAGIRRFTYPLAHDPSGSTKIGAFDLDVQVLGLDRSMGLSTRGYDLASEGDRRTLHATEFVPAGDLTVEYALPDRDKEVSAWAYAPAAVQTIAAPAQAGPQKARSDEEKAAAQTAAAILDDSSPYVAITVRPLLPRWREAKEHLHVLVVDASRSMFGERFARATHLASAIVREMDRRDSFLLLACDTVCRPMTTEQGGTAQPAAPGASASGDVERFLGSIEPDGGSDLAAAMAAARTAAGSLGGKELRILYLGDGTPSVGPTKPSHLETAVRSVVPSGDAAVVAVALGADADTTSLASLARGGGGVVVPYVPGQKISTAALEVLSAAYGVVLRDPEVELPSGFSQVTPSRLDPIRAGGETILVARMSGGRDVSGTLKLRGRVAGERFEQTYPVKVLASGSAGNAFVPRLYAAAKIAEIERAGGEGQRPTVVELSKRFAVASRFTSLLVLESEAMFKAFGLGKNAEAPAFTGEQQAESSTAQAEGDVPGDDGKPAADPSAAATRRQARARRPDASGAAPARGVIGGGGGDGFGSGHGGARRRTRQRPAAPPAASAVVHAVARRRRPFAQAAPAVPAEAPPPPRLRSAKAERPAPSAAPVGTPGTTATSRAASGSCPCTRSSIATWPSTRPTASSARARPGSPWPRARWPRRPTAATGRSTSSPSTPPPAASATPRSSRPSGPAATPSIPRRSRRAPTSPPGKAIASGPCASSAASPTCAPTIAPSRPASPTSGRPRATPRSPASTASPSPTWRSPMPGWCPPRSAARAPRGRAISRRRSAATRPTRSATPSTSSWPRRPRRRRSPAATCGSPPSGRAASTSTWRSSTPRASAPRGWARPPGPPSARATWAAPAARRWRSPACRRATTCWRSPAPRAATPATPPAATSRSASTARSARSPSPSPARAPSWARCGCSSPRASSRSTAVAAVAAAGAAGSPPSRSRFRSTPPGSCGIPRRDELCPRPARARRPRRPRLHRRARPGGRARRAPHPRLVAAARRRPLHRRGRDVPRRSRAEPGGRRPSWGTPPGPRPGPRARRARARRAPDGDRRPADPRAPARRAPPAPAPAPATHARAAGPKLRKDLDATGPRPPRRTEARTR